MPRNVRKIGFLACFLLVLLRVSIGWQFLYEGLWKLKTQNTSKPWSAEGYLANARGPFRDKFRGMLEDPNGFDKLDYDKVVAGWEAWRGRFIKKYADVPNIEAGVDKLLDGPKEFSQPLDELPPGIDLESFKKPKGYFLRYNAKAKRLETNLHLLPAERDALVAMAKPTAAPAVANPENADKSGTGPAATEQPSDEDAGKTRSAAEPPDGDAPNSDAPNSDAPNSDAPNSDAPNSDAQGSDAPNSDAQGSDAQGSDQKDGEGKDVEGKGNDDTPQHAVSAPPAAIDPVVKKWQDAVKQLYTRTSKLSLRERLEVLLKDDPDRVGQINKAQEGTLDYDRPGEKQVYEHLVARYEEKVKQVREAFQNDHLDNQWRKILEKKAKLIGPVDALTTEFRSGAYDLLKANQAKIGPVPEPDSKIRQINLLTMWSLTIIGAALMLGFMSRLSALGAAGLLLLFYLPMPPWPGVPEPPGPEHSLFVNKNLIEFAACLALAFLPTGRWIGVDACIRRFIFRRKTD